MQWQPNIAYPENEKPKLAALESLFREWHHHFASPSSGLEKDVADGMVFDGFCPYYLSQKKKILFIGREARDIEDPNYIDMMYRTYRGSQMMGTKKHLDNQFFHRRMLRIAYGITNGMPLWEDIPKASEIGRTFGDPNGPSFAFMNISKLPNEGEMSEKADWTAIKAAYALSTQPRNFLQEEVAILEPDIVITMSLVHSKLGDELAWLGESTKNKYSDQANSYWQSMGAQRFLLIDSYHFSAPGKNDEDDFYVPICDAIRHSEATSQSGGL